MKITNYVVKSNCFVCGVVNTYERTNYNIKGKPIR